MILLLLLALAARLALAAQDFVVAPDGATYLDLARRFAAGDWRNGFHPQWSPFYPFVAGLVARFTGDVELAGKLVSVFAGVGLVALLYRFYRQCYDAETAFVGAVGAAFFVHLLNYSAQAMTESLYLLLLVASLHAGWRALRENSLKYCCLTGILLGLSYLTRPEAFGYFWLFAVLALTGKFSAQPAAHKRNAQCAIALLVGALLCAGPYIWFIHHAAGVWTISLKLQANLLGGHIGTGQATRETAVQGWAAWLALSCRTALYNLKLQHVSLAYIFPPLLWPWLGLGLFGRSWTRERTQREIYLTLFLLATVAGYSITVVEARYLLPLAPVLLGWLAHGLVNFRDWLAAQLPFNGRLRGLLTARPLLLPVLCALALSFYLAPALALFTDAQAGNDAWLPRGAEFQQAGRWIKQQQGAGRRIISTDLRVPFYAEGERIQLPPKTTPEGLTALIAQERADFVVLTGRDIKETPELAQFLNEGMNPSGCAQVWQFAPPGGYKAIVWRVLRDY